MSAEKNRQFMKTDFAESDHQRSDQAKGLPFPPLQKEVPAGEMELVELPEPDPGVAVKTGFYQLLKDRESRRQFTDESFSLAELSFLLYSTQGVKEVVGEGYATRRTVPSAGARHPFETYLAVNRVEELTPGLYRYLPLTHQLLLLEPSAAAGAAGKSQPRAAFCGSVRLCFHLELHPLPGGMALPVSCPQKHAY